MSRALLLACSGIAEPCGGCEAACILKVLLRVSASISIESPLKCRNLVCIMHGALPIFRMNLMGALCHALERFCVPGPGSIHA